MSELDRPFNPWLREPNPWITRDLSYRLDMMERRQAALDAILAWDGASDLWTYARVELLAIDSQRDHWLMEADTLRAAHCSWPT